MARFWMAMGWTRCRLTNLKKAARISAPMQQSGFGRTGTPAWRRPSSTCGMGGSALGDSAEMDLLDDALTKALCDAGVEESLVVHR
jgi:hypothetical protein